MKRDADNSTDLATLVNTLDPAAIRAKLLELDSQQQALRVLLKSANARDRVRSRAKGASSAS